MNISDLERVTDLVEYRSDLKQMLEEIATDPRTVSISVNLNEYAIEDAKNAKSVAALIAKTISAEIRSIEQELEKLGCTLPDEDDKRQAP